MLTATHTTSLSYVDHHGIQYLSQDLKIGCQNKQNCIIFGHTIFQPFKHPATIIQSNFLPMDRGVLGTQTHHVSVHDGSSILIMSVNGEQAPGRELQMC